VSNRKRRAWRQTGPSGVYSRAGGEFRFHEARKTFVDLVRRHGAPEPLVGSGDINRRFAPRRPSREDPRDSWRADSS